MLPKSKTELDAIRDECKSMVTKRAGLSGAAAVVPVPGADIGADVMLLLEMIPMINRKFGLSPEQIDDLDETVDVYAAAGEESEGRVFNAVGGDWDDIIALDAAFAPPTATEEGSR